MARRYFGTDGVRGVFGRDLTPDLVERLGRAYATWSGGGEVLIGRDTRASGPELEQALARGVAGGGGTAVFGGVLPTPAAALLAGEDAAAVTASHNPPEYNGVKFFARGDKLTDEQEEEIEALLDIAATGGGVVLSEGGLGERYLDRVVERFGSDLSGLRLAVDCANGAYSGLAPRAFERLGAEVVAIGDAPDGSNINVGCGATDVVALCKKVADGGFDLGVAFDGDGDRIVGVDERGEPIDGDALIALLALHLRVDLVAVTTMTNLAFHALMREHGIRVVTTDVGDRYVLEALRREGGVLGGEQSGHVVYLDGHVTGDGLVAALLLCAALRGRRASGAAAILEPYPQAKENVHVSTKALPPAVLEEVERTNAQLDGEGRVLVRPSGTEPVVRVLAEAETVEKARNLCARIAALVRRELG